MKTRYIDLIDQTFDFPQEEFQLKNDSLSFHGIDLMQLIRQYGSPLTFCYLPQISNNINKAKKWFDDAIKKLNYKGTYNYCYCTKSSHFSYILDEVLKNDVHLETSSAFDINIVENLIATGRIDDSHYIICNGLKEQDYVNNIARLINTGHRRTIPVIDSVEELSLLEAAIDQPLKLGLRVASEEVPEVDFYTSRLGIGHGDIVPFFQQMVQPNPKYELRMLHFFINTGIRDSAYYWNEFTKCVDIYIALKKQCPELDCLNIGGGFPIKDSLAFDFDYAGIAEEILSRIKASCDRENVAVPHVFTEFGSFTVGESSGIIYSVLRQKQQNDKEKWYMINSSFITTLPDTWAIRKRFLMLPINHWHEEYQKVLLGGITCDGDDYYNCEQHNNSIYLPKFKRSQPLHIGFFNTGAYQDAIGGYGGIQHCLIPKPKKVIISKDSEGNLVSEVFSNQQNYRQVLELLGYETQSMNGHANAAVRDFAAEVKSGS